MASDSIRVSVRVRPLNAREQSLALSSRASWDLSETTITQQINDKPILSNSFAFDHVFLPSVDNASVYNAIARPVVNSAVSGINGTIFAYGQTAAGKTYTMLGTPQDPGVTRRAISDVVALCSDHVTRRFLMRASYIEIYNENIRDLLQPDGDNLKIHEDPVNKRVFVDSREEVVVKVDDVMDIIARGETARAVGETNMNERSSRSHTIFTLKIESREITAAEAHGDENAAVDEGVAIRYSTLSLVDLAGSERAAFTKAQGMRLVEGGHINKSLLTLGNVINKLSSGDPGSIAHIPYRDSKLTRLLQPALGGNARTAIVCAVTPAILHMEETLSTLKFASRAKKVTNHAKTNEYLDDRAKLRKAEKELASLKAEFERYKQGAVPANGAVISSKPTSVGSPGKLSRLNAFGKKFEKILSSVSPYSSIPSISRSKAYSDNLASLLIEPLQKLVPAVSTSAAEVELRKKVLMAEKRAVEAEKKQRQSRAEIEYERQAMEAEVETLVCQSSAAEEARRAAERECTEAHRALGNGLVMSIVESVVTEALTKSEVRDELKLSKRRGEQLIKLKGSFGDLKAQHGNLVKEHAEAMKRERRGVGPVMKEVRMLQNKLADYEKKYRSLKQNMARAGSEKTGIEKELKETARRNRALDAELEKHRSRVEKVQTRERKELVEMTKKHDATREKMQTENERLQTELKGSRAKLEHAEKLVRGNDAALVELGSVNEMLSKQAEAMAGQLKKTEKRRNELELEAKRYEAAVKARDEELTELREKGAQLDLAKRELKELEDTQKIQEDRLGQTQKELEKLGTRHAEAASELANNMQKLGDMEQESVKLKAELEGEKKTRLEVEDKVGELEQTMKTEKRMRESAEETSVVVVQQVEDLKNKLEKAEREIEETNGKKQVLEEQAEMVAKALKDAEMKNDVLCAKLEQVQAKIEETEKEMQITKEKLKEVEAEAGKTREILQRAEEKNKELREALTEAETRVTEMEMEIEKSGKRMSELEEEGRTLREKLVETEERGKTVAESLRVKMESQQKELDEACKKQEEAKTRIEELMKEVEEAKNGAEGLEDAQHGMEKATARAMKLEKELKVVREEVEKMRAANEQNAKEMQAFERMVEEERKAKEILEAEVKGLGDLQEMLRDERLRREQAEKEREIERERAERKDGEGWIEAEKALKDDVERTKEVNRLSVALAEKEKQLEKLEDLLDGMKRGEGVVKVLEDRIERRMRVIGRQERQMALVKAWMDGKSETEKEMLTKRLDAEGRAAEMDGVITRLQSKVQQLEKEVEQRIGEVRRMKDWMRRAERKRLNTAVSGREERMERLKRRRKGLSEVDGNVLKAPNAP